MKKNVGNSDKAIRFVIGLILGALGLFVVHSTVWTIVLLAVGVVMVFTSLSGFCLIYLPLGLDTFRTKGKTDQ